MKDLVKTLISFGIILADFTLHAFPLEIKYQARLIDFHKKPIEGPIDLQIKFYRSESATQPIDLQETNEGVDADTDSLFLKKNLVNMVYI